MNIYQYLLLGFFGNQPFLTLSSCSKSSLILHRQEIPKTAIRELMTELLINNEMKREAIPVAKNRGQIFFEK